MKVNINANLNTTENVVNTKTAGAENSTADIRINKSFLNGMKLSKFIREVSEDNDGERKHFDFLPEVQFSDVFKNGKREQTGIIPQFVIDDLCDMFCGCKKECRLKGKCEGKSKCNCKCKTSLTQLIKYAIMYELSKEGFNKFLSKDGNASLSPPFSSTGSKSKMYYDLLRFILEQLDISIIKEIFGRTAALSMCHGGVMRIYNDADPLWSNFNRCLRDDVGKLIVNIKILYKHMNELAKLPEDVERANASEEELDECVKRATALHKYFREELEAFYRQYEENKKLKSADGNKKKKGEAKRDSDGKKSDKLDYMMAAKLFILINHAMAGDFGQDFKSNISKDIKDGKTLRFNESRLRICSCRIQNMSIACGDFEKAIKMNTVDEEMIKRILTFIDPPYLPKRNKKGKIKPYKGYLKEFTIEDMRRLFRSTRKCKNPMILTHYANKTVHNLADESGFKAYFAFRNGDKVEIVYMKNIDLDMQLMEERLAEDLQNKSEKKKDKTAVHKTVLCLDPEWNFADMVREIKEGFTKLTKDEAESLEEEGEENVK
jgi:hypothetical protein